MGECKGSWDVCPHTAPRALGRSHRARPAMVPLGSGVSLWPHDRWWLYGDFDGLCGDYMVVLCDYGGETPPKKKLGFQSIGGKTWTGNQIWGFPVKMLNCSYHLILGMMEGSDIPFPWKHAQSNWSTSRKKNMTLRQTFSSRHIDNPRPGCFCDMLTSTLR